MSWGGGAGEGGQECSRLPLKIKKESFQGKNWRNSGKNKSREFYLRITYPSGWLYLLLQEWTSLTISLI